MKSQKFSVSSLFYMRKTYFKENKIHIKGFESSLLKELIFYQNKRSVSIHLKKEGIRILLRENSIYCTQYGKKVDFSRIVATFNRYQLIED